MSTILLISTIVLIVLIVGGGIYFFSWYRALGELRDKQAHLNYADAIAAFAEAGHPKFEVTLDIVESVPNQKADGKFDGFSPGPTEKERIVGFYLPKKRTLHMYFRYIEEDGQVSQFPHSVYEPIKVSSEADAKRQFDEQVLQYDVRANYDEYDARDVDSSGAVLFQDNETQCSGRFIDGSIRLSCDGVQIRETPADDWREAEKLFWSFSDQHLKNPTQN